MNDKKSEAQQSLDTLFGPESYQNLNALQKLKLRLIGSQYKKETPLFKLIFDKHFRPARYNAIIESEEGTNKNSLRTLVNQLYCEFPPETESLMDLTIKFPSQANKDEDIYLHEKQYLKMFMRTYQLELLVYLLLANSMIYLAGSLKMGVFSSKISIAILAPGFIANAYCLHMRRNVRQTQEAVLGDKQAQEWRKYKWFCNDEKYL